jgi:hypothetical protein
MRLGIPDKGIQPPDICFTVNPLSIILTRCRQFTRNIVRRHLCQFKGRGARWPIQARDRLGSRKALKPSIAQQLLSDSAVFCNTLGRS